MNKQAVLAAIIHAVQGYHFALDTRQHGGVAANQALNAVMDALGMHWRQGAEKARREAPMPTELVVGDEGPRYTTGDAGLDMLLEATDLAARTDSMTHDEAHIWLESLEAVLARLRPAVAGALERAAMYCDVMAQSLTTPGMKEQAAADAVTIRAALSASQGNSVVTQKTPSVSDNAVCRSNAQGNDVVLQKTPSVSDNAVCRSNAHGEREAAVEESPAPLPEARPLSDDEAAALTHFNLNPSVALRAHDLLRSVSQVQPVRDNGAVAYPSLPLPEWTKHDDLGGRVPSDVRVAMREFGDACVDADRAQRPAAPAAVKPEGHAYDTGDAGLDDLLTETAYMIEGPNSQDTAMLWLQAMEKVRDRLAAAATPPEGMVLAPHFRGYAALGTRAYLLSPCVEGGTPCLVIHIATEADKAGREVGERRDTREPGKLIQPEAMAVRLDFLSERGLFALEDMLAEIRRDHFSVAAEWPQIGEMCWWTNGTVVYAQEWENTHKDRARLSGGRCHRTEAEARAALIASVSAERTNDRAAFQKWRDAMFDTDEPWDYGGDDMYDHWMWLAWRDRVAPPVPPAIQSSEVQP